MDLRGTAVQRILAGQVLATTTIRVEIGQVEVSTIIPADTVAVVVEDIWDSIEVASIKGRILDFKTQAWVDSKMIRNHSVGSRTVEG